MLGLRRVRSATVSLVVGSVLAVWAVPAGAAGSPPQVVFGESSTTVSYRLSAPLGPDDPAEQDTAAGSGLQSRRTLSRELSNDHGRASATTTQSAKSLHGPTPSGYSLRKIVASGALSGIAEIKEVTGPPVTSTADADSETTFTVNRTSAFALSTTRSAQTDHPADCSKSSVTLSRAGTVVFRKTTATEGCSGVLEDIGANGGDLPPGDYTLETHAEGAAQAHGSEGTGVRDLMAAAVATLQLGTGRVCRNVLPTTGATITGSSGNDVLCGGPGADTIKGYAGNDLILGMGSGDTIAGGGGADVIKPGGGRDSVGAGRGNDTVSACDGLKDTLGGGRGTDSVRRDGVDVLSSFETKTRC